MSADLPFVLVSGETARLASILHSSMRSPSMSARLARNAMFSPAAICFARPAAHETTVLRRNFLLHLKAIANALCFMLYALCFMLYALCFMLYALCFMLYALCFMLYRP
jgi:hypothetical protein